MEFSELAFRRYSCRNYLDKPVEREKLSVCVEAARMSPSACNSQRWLFIAVDDKDKCAVLADALHHRELGVNAHAAGTPAYIVIVKDPVKEMTPRQCTLIGQGEYWDMDVGIAAQNICLSATDQGLGTVMMGLFDREKVRGALEIPQDREIPLIIGLGYPQNDVVRKKTRKELGQIMRWNSFHNSDS